MAVDMFIQIGALKGEAKDKAKKEWVDVLAWTWGMANSGSAGVLGGAGSGKVQVHDLSIIKYVDKSTPDLMLSCANGKHFDKATLVCRKAGEHPLEYLTITLNDLIISSISSGASTGDDRLTENVTLNFAKFKVEYKEQLETGGAGASPQMGWDIQGNAQM